MNPDKLQWAASYAVPAALQFRVTPAGNLQMVQDGAGASVEVRRAHVDLLLDLARAQSAEQAFAEASSKWEIEREAYRRLLEVWLAQGLLCEAAAGPHATTRLALFARALERHAAAPSRPFPLVSPFALQRPLLYYPGLETREVHDRRRFPWAAGLEDAFPAIQAEFAGIVSSSAFARVHPGQTTKGEWAAARLWAFGRRVEEVCAACPQTCAILGSIPGVARFGTTLFSALAPRSQIAPHHGYTNAKLRCQLPLRVPPGCRLKVGDAEIEQRQGQCILFDDSFLHSAWNDSDEARFVLVFDFFHPDLAAEEIEFLTRFAQQEELAEQYLGPSVGAEKAAWVRT